MSTDAIVNVTDDFLAGLSDEFAKATEPLPKGGVPEGHYYAKFNGVTPGQSQTTGIKYLNLDFEIVGPDDSEYLGAPIVLHFGFAKPQNFEMFKRTLRAMKVADKDLGKAIEALAELVGTTWAVTAKHSSDGLYCNYYVNRQVAA